MSKAKIFEVNVEITGTQIYEVVATSKADAEAKYGTLGELVLTEVDTAKVVDVQRVVGLTDSEWLD
jgi:hypothetical protein